LIAAALAVGMLQNVPQAIAKEPDKNAIRDQTPASANAALVTRFLTEVVNGGRFDLIEQLWAPDLLWHGGSSGEVRGMPAYRKMLEASVGGAFTGMHLDIKDVIDSGDKVVVRFTNSGTHAGAFMGYAATRKQVVWEGIGIYRIRDGKIVEAWFSEDLLGMFMGLGLLPARN